MPLYILLHQLFTSMEFFSDLCHCGQKKFKESHAGHEHQAEFCEIHLPVQHLCCAQVNYGGKKYPCNMVFRQGRLKQDTNLDDDTICYIECNNTVEFIFLEDEIILGEESRYSGSRPCPKCGMLIARKKDSNGLPIGCYRTNCISCGYSFWFPSGESWDSYSERKTKEKDTREWWNFSRDEEWIPYWRDWECYRVWKNKHLNK